MGANLDKAKGKAKELEGRLTGDRIRQGQGKAEKAKGDVEGAVKRGVRRVKGAMNRAKGRAQSR